MRAGEEKGHFRLPVEEGSQLLGYVGSEFGGGLKLVAILIVFIHLMPINTHKRTSESPAQKLPQ